VPASALRRDPSDFGAYLVSVAKRPRGRKKCHGHPSVRAAARSLGTLLSAEGPGVSKLDSLWPLAQLQVFCLFLPRMLQLPPGVEVSLVTSVSDQGKVPDRERISGAGRLGVPVGTDRRRCLGVSP